LFRPAERQYYGDMVGFRRGPRLAVSALGLSLGLAAVLAPVSRPARADDANCRLVNVDFTPGGIPAGMRVPPGTPATGSGAGRTVSFPEIDPQVVAWIETASGAYVDTIYITQQTGRYGIGNRPGRFDFNSGPSWPYGRRITVFPVWSHKHGIAFPQINYRNGDDKNLSHPYTDSSRENHFCRPLQIDEAMWDAGTCSSIVYTDKGVFSPASSGYPPRADLTPAPGMDSPSVARYRALNQFDAVSQATPALGTTTQISWPIPPDLATGDYALVMEVALEQDFNDSYSVARYPSPSSQEIPYSDYGVPYRGQPSVVYRVPFQIADVETVAMTDHYAGYGDPTGADGALRPPDATITSDLPNSGASRLLLTSRDGDLFRVRVTARPERDATPPGAPGAMVIADARAGAVTLEFAAPGGDGQVGTVRGYEVRYLAGDTPITAANFNTANVAVFTGAIAPAGQPQVLTIKDLLPETEYSVAVRAYDDCHNISAITTASFTTAARLPGEVDACFIATAAYGSLLANDVEMLRRFRDSMLSRTVLGQLAVETYYTFGPPVAGVVGESDLLRATARDALAPLVERVRQLRW
jgi:hypothetical protein